MNILDIIKKIHHKEKNKEVNLNELKTHIKASNINLNIKVAEFLKWFDTFNQKDTQKLHDLIEKIAVFYELAYPDENIIKIISNMYQNPDYKSQSLIDYKLLFGNLNGEELSFIKKPKYPSLVYVNPNRYTTHFHLTSKGITTEAENIADLDKDSTIPRPSHDEYIGKNISDVIEFFKNASIQIENSELEKTYETYIFHKHSYEETLNCIMYRIIERGGHRVGPYRAFLFAKDFKRNIEVPMSYAIDYSDPHLREFINEYIKAGGKKELICYANYFFRENDDSIIEIVNLKEILPTSTLNAGQKYTQEETELHQRLVNIIHSKIDEDTKKQIDKQQIIKLRLQRKKQ